MGLAKFPRFEHFSFQQPDDNTAFTLSSIIKRIQLERSVLDTYRKLGYNNAQKYKLEDQILSLMTLSQKVIKGFHHYEGNTEVSNRSK